MNKVVLVGRLTKDPELKKTNTDISYVQFTLAINRPYQSKNGDKQADFINCIVWRAPAENLAKFIRKGGQIGVDGQIQTRNYDDQNGVRHFITEVVCDNVYFLESKKDNQASPYDYNQGGMGGFNQNSYNQPSNQNFGFNQAGFNQSNYNQKPNNFNNYNNYNEQPYNKPMNNQNRGDAPQKQKSPFDDIDSQFDISSDDLPF